MPDAVRILAKRTVKKLPCGERDGGWQALGQGPLRGWRHEQVIVLLLSHLEVSRRRRASMISASSLRVAYSPRETACSASGSPLRVIVTCSWVRTTSSTRADRWAFTSASGAVFIDQNSSLISDALNRVSTERLLETGTGARPGDDEDDRRCAA